MRENDRDRAERGLSKENERKNDETVREAKDERERERKREGERGAEMAISLFDPFWHLAILRDPIIYFGNRKLKSNFDLNLAGLAFLSL